MSRNVERDHRAGFCIIESRKNIARGGGGEGMRELFPTCTSVTFVDHTRLSLFLTHRQHFR